jgi:hypothetical protein
MSMDLIQLVPWGDVTLTKTREKTLTFLGSTYSYNVWELRPALLRNVLTERLSETEMEVATFEDPSPSDQTAPILTNPSASNAFSDNLSGQVKTDEAEGVLYYVVTESSAAPSKDQVAAGQDETGTDGVRSGTSLVGADGTQGFFEEGMPGGTWHVHWMHRDEADNRSAVVSSGPVTI